MNKSLLTFFTLTILAGWSIPFLFEKIEPTFLGKTNDANTGRNQQEIQNNELHDFELIDSQNGWLIVNEGFYLTKDGGNTWIDRTPTWDEGWLIRDAQFLDANAGWLAATQVTQHESDNFLIAKTANGGLSWNLYPQVFFSSSDPDGSTDKISLSFINTRTGWMVIKPQSSANFNRGLLFKTMDGGKNWQRLEIPIGDGTVFTDSNHGWTAGGAAGNELYNTLDGGNTWRAISLAEVGESQNNGLIQYQLPVFSHQQNGLLPVIFSGPGSTTLVFFHSPDGGLTWENISSLSLDNETAVRVNYPITAIDDHTWLINVPAEGQLYQVDSLTRQTTLKYQDTQLKGVMKISAGGEQTLWAGYLRGACAGSECLVENGIVRYQKPHQNLDQLELPGGFNSKQIVLSPESLAGTESNKEEQVSALNLTLAIKGQGFDKCEIASLAQFKDWIQTSPYKTTNLYIGGISRACSNLALTAQYLYELRQQGWRFIPTWVGPQPPCTAYNNKIPTNTSEAYQKGIDEAKAAVDKAASLGLTASDKSGSVLYYDIEGYDVTNLSCNNAVKAFVNGWSYQVKQSKNLPGVYGRGTVMTEMAGIANPPQVIWPANWYCPEYPNPCVYRYREDATVWNVSGLSNTLWANHQRIRQYAGGHAETWGTTTLNIDSNVIDGVVADISGALPLWVKKDGTGSGTVTSNPAGVSCGSTCYVNFAPQTTVTLTAVPIAGSVFTGWKGDCDIVNQNTCQVTLNTYKQVTATFNLAYLLTTSKSGNGSGTIISSPDGINCGIACSAFYAQQAEVTLSANPAPGSSLKGWEGPCVISGNSCKVKMSQAQNVSAIFSTNQLFIPMMMKE